MSAVMPLQAVPARPKPASTVTRSGLLLQRKCACGAPAAAPGHTCDSCAAKAALQAKYTIGAGNDPLEHEADRVADAVLAAAPVAATAGAQGRAAPRIQRFSGAPSAPLAAAPASVERVLASPGRALDAGLQRDMGQRFGHDFSAVRVHADAAAGRSAQEVNAHAYTVGRHIAFAPGRFAPATRDGRRLLAHELTHVVQQSGSAPGAGMPAVLRRAEVAGCRSDVLNERQIGDRAHEAIQGWCRTQVKGCHAEVPIVGGSSKGTGNTGFADLMVGYLSRNKIIEVGEIKPRGSIVKTGGYEQLMGYIAALQAAYPNKTIKTMDWIPGPPNGMLPFLGQNQYLGCAPGSMGMYFYQCLRNQRKPEWAPRREAVPKEVLEQIKERLKQLEIELGPQPGPEQVPQAARELSETEALAIAALVTIGIALAIFMIPAETVAAIVAGIVAVLRVAAALLGLTSLAYASEGGSGGDKKEGATTGVDGGADGAGGGKGVGSASGSGTGGNASGTPGKGSGKAGGAWDPVLDLLKQPGGSKLSPQDVALIKARLPALIAVLRKAAADDPNAQDIMEILDRLERLSGTGSAAPQGKPAPGGEQGTSGPAASASPGGTVAPGAAGTAGVGAGDGASPRATRPPRAGRFVAPVPAPAGAETQGTVTYAYESGLERLLLANWKVGATYDVVIAVSIDAKPALSRLGFKVDRREDDQILLSSTNTASLIVRPDEGGGWLVIAPGSVLRYRPADAPRPPAPKQGGQ